MAWTPEPGFEPGEDTAALGVAADGDRRVVVGRRGADAAAWVSDAGGAWQASPASPALEATGSGTAEMRAVAPWHGGWVAVGSVDADADHRSPRSGRRPTASHGSAGPASPGSSARPPTGSQPPATASSSWVFRRGRERRCRLAGGRVDLGRRPAWTPVESPAFAVGPMRAVAATPAGFVAVGFGIDDTRAAAWMSPDGSAWTAVPDQPAFEALGKPIRMAAVASNGGGLVAEGWKSDAGNGSGIVWRSPDGTRGSASPTR